MVPFKGIMWGKYRIVTTINAYALSFHSASQSTLAEVTAKVLPVKWVIPEHMSCPSTDQENHGPTEQLPMGHLRANPGPAGNGAVTAGRAREEVLGKGYLIRVRPTSFMALKHEAINSSRFSHSSDTFSTLQLHSLYYIPCHVIHSILFFYIPVLSTPLTLFQSIPFKHVEELSWVSL